MSHEWTDSPMQRAMAAAFEHAVANAQTKEHAVVAILKRLGERNYEIVTTDTGAWRRLYDVLPRELTSIDTETAQIRWVKTYSGQHVARLGASIAAIWMQQNASGKITFVLDVTRQGNGGPPISTCRIGGFLSLDHAKANAGKALVNHHRADIAAQSAPRARRRA